jgi:transcription elongation GreA/GreB family factor
LFLFLRSRPRSRAKGPDFASVKTDAVSLCTKVNLTDTANNQPEVYSILGAWDGDPDDNLISCLPPMGQALLNRKGRRSGAFEIGGTTRNLRIDSIIAA